MARGYFRYNHETGKVEELEAEAPITPRLEVITDSLPPGGLKHPITGKYMDSKSEFRKVTKAFGCEELGNEKPRDRRQMKVPGLKQDIREAIERSASRR